MAVSATGRGRPRLVVLRALGLGDLLTVVPALRALARAFPEHERVLAAPIALGPLAALVDADGGPAVHRVLPTAELTPLSAELEEAGLAVNLHGCGPQSHRLVLAARPRAVIWFEHADVAESRGSPSWRADEHEVARWCRLLHGYGIAADPEELAVGAPRAAVERRKGRGAGPGLTVVHPGAASPARRWPAARFAAVARAEAERGARVLLTGSPSERALAEAVARAAGLSGAAVLAGRTDLAELATVVAGADRVVCGDTGMGHLATALGTPSVLLFGPTDPARWGPPPARGQHIVLWAGRTGEPHAPHVDPGLLSITVDDVLEALARLPERALKIAAPPALTAR